MSLTPSQRREASNAYRTILRRDFVAFIQASFNVLFPGLIFRHHWYIDLIASKLEEVRFGRCRRLIINIPPRHLKSFITSVVFPAWLLGHNSRSEIMAISYGQDLSDKFARDCRTLMASALYRWVFETHLASNQMALAEFGTTAGGVRKSTSIGGVVTGRGGDTLIIDDPMKADEALSDLRREYVKKWFNDSLLSRLNNHDTGAIIIVMQRLHADDLVAHVQQHAHWDILSLPAIAERDEVYSFDTVYGRRVETRKANTVLHPDLISRDALDGLRDAMSEYTFAAQFQQEPQPPAGNLFKRHWLRSYNPDQMPDTFDQIVQSWDTASKMTELADYSVCVTLGIKGSNAYVLDVHRRKIGFPELKQRVRELADLHHASVVLVEDTSSGTSLIQQLQADGFSIAHGVSVGGGDKVMRARAESAKFEGGFVLVPENAPWLSNFLLELTAFPNSRHDDQVDAIVNALAWTTGERIKPGMGIFRYYEQLADRAKEGDKVGPEWFRVEMPGESTHFITIKGRYLMIPPDRVIELSQEELPGALRAGGKLLSSFRRTRE